jgi:hypothetical protein
MCSAVPALAQQTVLLDEAHQGRGNKGSGFRPVNTTANSAPFVLTARSNVASNDSSDPDAAGALGTICIDDGTNGCGVQDAWGSGSYGISGSGTGSNEELILLFDAAIPASSLSLDLTSYSPGSGTGSAEDAVIFLFSYGNMGEYDVTISEQEIVNAFTSTGSGKGRIDFSRFSSIPSNLRIHAAKFRMTRRHGAVTGVRCDEPEECESVPDGKVAICHIPPGNPSNAHTIIVSESAVAAHLAHGDSLGECEDCPEETGACCYTWYGYEKCRQKTSSECDALGGQFHGVGSECDDDDDCPPETGACCKPDGTCSIKTEDRCYDIGGNYLGDNTSCDDCPSQDGACCFTDGTCQVTSESNCYSLGGHFQGGGTECPAQGTVRYELHNHPDGGAAPPLYGLRLDGLLTGDGSDVFSFDFDHAQSAVFMDVGATTVHIFGHAFGGRDVGSSYTNAGVWLIDFTYAVGVTTAAGDDDLIVNNCGSVNTGTIQATFGSNQSPIALVDFCGGNPFSFRFGNEEDDNGHRGFSGLSGWGWLNHSGQAHISASDWLFTAEVVCPEPPQTGACCFSDGTCAEISELSCGVLGGNFLGAGTSCNDCPPLTGACCKDNGTCAIKTEADCAAIGGNFLGAGTSCDDCPPLTGACCFSDGTCAEISELSCGVLGGNFLGAGTTCDDCPPLTGACCKDNGTCAIKTEADCNALGGNFLGVGTSCDDCPPLTGACCFSDGRQCIEISDLSCGILGGTFQGGGTTCAQADCPEVPDCNQNNVIDSQDISSGTSEDCNGNMIPDECEIDVNSTAPGGPFFCTMNCDPDCNNNGIPDECDIANCDGSPGCQDCNGNGVPDSCDIANGSNDCNGNMTPDECEIDVNSTAPGGPFFCTMNCDPDCNNNGIPDECDIANCDGSPGCQDCNGNGIPDSCDIANGSNDCNGNMIPDECEIDVNSTAPGGPFFCTMNCDPDCNNNGIPDECDIANCDGSPGCQDCNGNGVPDSCDIANGSNDCNGNMIPDECEIDVNSTAPGGPFFCTMNCDPDCNNNGIPDECDIANCDGSPGCQDCNGNGIPDECDIANCDGLPECSDCNDNGIPDGCEVVPNGNEPDCNNNGIPDSCEMDCNSNGVPDDCDVDPSDPDGNGQVSEDCDSNMVPDECQPDTDMDGIIDACDLCEGTPFGDSVDTNGCAIITCDAGGPYSAVCTGGVVVINLSGSATGQVIPPPDTMLVSEWTTDCEGAVIADPFSEQTTITIDTAVTGCPLACSISFNCRFEVIPGSSAALAGIGTGGPLPTSTSTTTIGLFLDCNGNLIDDLDDIANGTSLDCNGNSIPDECEVAQKDCNGNGIPDDCDIDPADPDGNGQVSPDCNDNGIPDECEVPPIGTGADCNSNGVPDECDPDSDGDGIPDDCDEPTPQTPPCDPNDNPLSLLFTLLFHAPVCGMGCPSMIAMTLCGLMVMRTGRRRWMRRRRR